MLKPVFVAKLRSHAMHTHIHTAVRPLHTQMVAHARRSKSKKNGSLHFDLTYDVAPLGSIPCRSRPRKPEKGIRLLRHLSQSAVLLPIHQNSITLIEVDM